MKNPHAIALGRRGGKVSSPAKTKAVRANAKKGEWPKGKPRKPSTRNPMPHRPPHHLRGMLADLLLNLVEVERDALVANIQSRRYFLRELA